MCDAALLTFEANFIALQLSSLKRDEVQMMEKWKLPQKIKYLCSHICLLSTNSSHCCTWFCTPLPKRHHHQNTQKVKKNTYFNQTIKKQILMLTFSPKTSPVKFCPYHQLSVHSLFKKGDYPKNVHHMFCSLWLNCVLLCIFMLFHYVL